MLIVTKAFIEGYNPTEVMNEDLGISNDIEVYLRDAMFRTEDVKMLHIDPNNAKQTIVRFYDEIAKPLICKEEFSVLAERVLNLELETYYSPEQIDAMVDEVKNQIENEGMDSMSIEKQKE